jgi:hypothetical protein
MVPGTKALLVIAAGAAAMLAVPAPAWAKGPSQATVAGPGLAAPVVVRGDGEPGTGGRLADLADGTGLFAAMFGQTPDPMRSAPPTRDLGPRYIVTYLLPGGTRVATIEQELYPFAAQGPVTYLAPGQSFFDTERTRGGWYRAAPALLHTLRDLGLPAAVPVAAVRPSVAPSSGPASSQPAAEPPRQHRTVIVVVTAALALLVLLSIALTRARSPARRSPGR